MDTSSHSLEKGLLPGGKKRAGALTTGIIAAVSMLVFYLIISAVINSRITSQTSDLQSKIDANTALINTLKGQITELQVAVNNQNAKTNTLSDNVANLTTTVSDLNTTVNDVSGNFAGIVQNVTDLQTLTTTQGDNIKTLNTNVGAVQDSLKSLKDEVQDDEGDIKNLQDTVKTQGDSIADLTKTVDAQDLKITGLSTNLNTLQTNTNTNFTAVNGRVDTLTTNLNTNVQQINDYVQPNYRAVSPADQKLSLTNFDPQNPKYTNILGTALKLNSNSKNAAYGVCTFTVYSPTASAGSKLYLAALLGDAVAGDGATFVYSANTNIVFTTSFKIPTGANNLNFGIGLDGLAKETDFDLQVLDGYCNFYGAASA